MRRTIAVVVLACAAIVVMTGLATAKGNKKGPHGQKGPQTCTGTLAAPGTLSGTYAKGVVINGFCAVDAGPADVVGLLKLAPGSGLIAAFGHNNSHLTVNGNVLVGHGATFLLGCNTTSFGCVDDPNMNALTLSSKGRVTGNVTEAAPLGVIIHNASIGGNVTQTGGGGGETCTTMPPPFSKFMSPVYSAYEDSTIKGNVSITGMHSCWLGMARVNVRGNVTLHNNKFADPDAIEIVGNNVHGNLVCRSNAPTVWDSAETSMTANFPRKPDPNTVHGNRVGQCNRSTPTTMGGPSGPKNSF